MSGADLKQMKTTKKAPDVTASAVDEGHRTVPMPFGHALIKLAETRPEIVGMSADLEAAIAAGSTMVRVGTAVFGTR